MDLFGRLIFRKPGMGLGDAYIGAAIGAMLGPWLALLSFGFAIVLGALVGIALIIAGALHPTPAPGAAPAGEATETIPMWLGEAEGEEKPALPGETPTALTAEEPGREEPEEVPEWLRALAETARPSAGPPVPAATEAELPSWLATLIEQKAPAIEETAGATPEVAATEAVSASMLEEMVAEAAAPSAEAAEITPAEAPSVAAPPPEEAIAAETAPAEMPTVAAPAPEPVAAAVTPEPLEQAPVAEAPTALAEKPVSAGAAELPRGAPTSPFIGQAIERLRVRPDDHEMRLTLARAWRDAGELDSAANHYDVLIQSDQHVDMVVADLERLMPEHRSNHTLWTLLGDAYMKQGRLSDALSAYRSALGR